MFNSNEYDFNQIVELVRAERTRQDIQWGGPEHDDEHLKVDWINFIRKQALKALEAIDFGYSASAEDRYYDAVLKITALGFACLESRRRKRVQSL